MTGPDFDDILLHHDPYKNDKSANEQYRDNFFLNQRNGSREGFRSKITEFSKYIDTCKSKGILPKPVGITSRKYDDEYVDLKETFVGDGYAEALSETLKER